MAEVSKIRNLHERKASWSLWMTKPFNENSKVVGTWLTDKLTDRQTDWQTSWLTDKLIASMMNCLTRGVGNSKSAASTAVVLKQFLTSECVSRYNRGQNFDIWTSEKAPRLGCLDDFDFSFFFFFPQRCAYVRSLAAPTLSEVWLPNFDHYQGRVASGQQLWPPNTGSACVEVLLQGFHHWK